MRKLPEGMSSYRDLPGYRSMIVVASTPEIARSTYLGDFYSTGDRKVYTPETWTKEDEFCSSKPTVNHETRYFEYWNPYTNPHINISEDWPDPIDSLIVTCIGQTNGVTNGTSGVTAEENPVEEFKDGQILGVDFSGYLD